MLHVEPLNTRDGDTWTFQVPPSKPETQRAFLVAALANGRSIIRNDLRCGETNLMRRALEAVGVKFQPLTDGTAIEGLRPRSTSARDVPVINCGGSALVCRVFRVLGCTMPGAVVLTGDDILRRRELRALSETLDRHNTPADYLCDDYRLPLVVRGGGLRAGTYRVPGDITSQFITALLLAAPRADGPITIVVDGTVLSGSYVRQTLAAMHRAGVSVAHDETLREFRVEPAPYVSICERLSGDYTSASYLLAAAALFEGTTVLRNLRPDSLQGERAMLQVIEALGVSYEFDRQNDCLVIANRRGRLRGDFEFDASDCPNIVPTLAALGSYVEGRFRVVGAGITNRHKSPRIAAMAAELRKIGVDIVPCEKNGHVDGFEIHGRHVYEGGQELSSWRDHRVFMSLFVASLRTRRPNTIDGEAIVADSFPDFLDQFAQNGLGRPRPEVRASAGDTGALRVPAR